jgi:carboxypeptidase family protein/TonB-dependent receptor-like protein
MKSFARICASGEGRRHHSVSRRAVCLATALLSISLGSSGFGQVNTGTISGVVQDQSGATVPGATVVVKNVATGLTRTVTANDKGRYYAPALPIGDYELQAGYSGFQTEVRKGIVLGLGQELIVDFKLVIGEITQQISVSGQAPLVDTESARVADIVTPQQIRDLPLNGRDFTQLALMEAGVSRVLNVGNSTGRGFGTPISFAGARPNQSVYLLDGTDMNTATSFSMPGSVAGVVLGVDTVQEFQVLISNYSSQFGRAAGGIVNAVTRSGTNEFHGSAFEFLRNSALDARNFFDRALPPFRRNQFGATLGGPIKKDKTFFFGAFEGLRQSLSSSAVENVPDTSARLGLIPDPRIPGSFTDVGLNPVMKPYLDLFPLPNGRNFGNGIAEYVYSLSNPISENYVLGKMDHSFSSQDSMFGRYVFDGAQGQAYQPGLVNITRNSYSRMQYATVEETHVFSPAFLNTFRAAFNRSNITDSDHFLRDISPSLSYVPGITLGQTDIPGLTNPGGDHREPGKRIQSVFQYSDDASFTRGRHALKFGMNIERFRFNRLSTNSQNGWFQFGSFVSYLQGKPSTVFLNMPGSDPARGWRQYLMGFYGQDDFKMTSRVTINLGLRYEFITTPTEVNGKVTNMRDFLHDTNTTVGDPLFHNPSLRNFAPRVGFAWDPSGQGKLAVRGGFGMFFDQILPSVFSIAGGDNPPFSLLISANNPVFPVFYSQTAGQLTQGIAISPTTFSTTDFEFKPRQPYVMKWNLSVEKQLPGNIVASASYLGSRGNHLPSLVDQNTVLSTRLADGRYFVPPNGTRRNPNYGPIVADPVFNASAVYNALLLKVSKRFSGGLQFGSSYTYARVTDDSTTGIGGSDFVSTGWAPENTDCTKCEHALSNLDIRNSFVTNLTYELPFGRKRSGWERGLLGGWQVGGILTLSSGNPFSVTLGFNQAPTLSRIIGHQRPDLVSGFSNNPTSGVTQGCTGVAAGQKLGTPDLFYNPCAFALPQPGFFGNLGRNTVISPGLADLDFSLFKNIHMRERAHLQFRAEIFNLLNRANFGRPAVLNVFDSRGVVSNAARITSTLTPSRQIQFGLKLTF